MISVLGYYLSRLFLGRLVLMLFGLAATAILIDLVAASDDIIKPGDDVALVLGKYALFRLPGILSQVIPITVLVAALITFAGLARNSELAAILGAGVSPLKQVRVLLPAVALVAVVQFVIEDQALPRSTNALRDWGVGDYGDVGQGDDDRPTWFRQGNNFVRMRSDDDTGDVMRGIDIFRRDAEGQLIERIQADSATYRDGVWSLKDVTRTLADEGTVTKSPGLDWPEAIEFSILRSLTLHPKELTWIELRRLAARSGYATRPLYLYEMWIHKKIARPLATVLMVLLAVASVQHILPRRQPGLMLTVGIAIGFVFWICDELVVTVGEAGLLPPMVAAWAPPLVLGALCATVILRDDGA